MKISQHGNEMDDYYDYEKSPPQKCHKTVANRRLNSWLINHMPVMTHPFKESLYGC